MGINRVEIIRGEKSEVEMSFNLGEGVEAGVGVLDT